MSPLQILIEQLSASSYMLTFIGQMDESNVDSNAPTVYDVIEKIPQGGSLILNFSGLTYMNSKSIGYTTDFYNKVVDEKGGKLIVAESPENILDILTVVGLTNIITFTTSVAEAKAIIAGEDTQESIVEEVTETPTEEISAEAPQEETTPHIEIKIPEVLTQSTEEKIVEEKVEETPVVENIPAVEEKVIPAEQPTPAKTTEITLDEDEEFPWTILAIGGIAIIILIVMFL
ncbi:hypothetical protein COB57_04780 [Candidatus Peregrinibacteria bacterium]|nr:MAG: hypothetical protein COB57_04780 [Candidatus Peregrinibacteria bacterium]